MTSIFLFYIPLVYIKAFFKDMVLSLYNYAILFIFKGYEIIFQIYNYNRNRLFDVFLFIRFNTIIE